MTPDKVILYFILLFIGGGFLGFGVFSFYEDKYLGAIIFITIGIVLLIYFFLYGPNFSIYTESN
jgi:hypothetical protein